MGETFDDLELGSGGQPGTSLDDPSGHERAAAAYNAGAVESRPWLPTCEVVLEFRVHGVEERARNIADQLTTLLALTADVAAPVTATVQERPS